MNAPSSDEILVARLQASLPDGHLRFFRSSAPLREAWFPTRPAELQEFLSDYNTADLDEPEQEDALRHEWRNEILAIMKILEEGDAQDPTVDQSDPGARLEAGLARRARALYIWDEYGVPLRLRARTVYRIQSPRDALGDPVILSIPLSSFIVMSSAKTAHDAVTIGHLTNALSKWRLSALIAVLGFLALLLWTFR